MSDEKQFVLIPPGKLLCLSDGDGNDPAPSSAIIKCEIDGIPVAGVCFATIEIDRDGDSCLMLFTDPTLIAHMRSESDVRDATGNDPES
jgi:hypothetical protein